MLTEIQVSHLLNLLNRKDLLSSVCIMTTDLAGQSSVELVGNIDKDKSVLIGGLIKALYQIENPNC